MPFAAVFLLTYACGVLILLNGGPSPLKFDLARLFSPEVTQGMGLLFFAAPLIAMLVGGGVAAKSGQRDQRLGTLNPRNFLFGFDIGFGTAWFVTFPLGLLLLVGTPKLEQILTPIGGLNIFVLRGVIPALSLRLGTNAQSAWARPR